MKTIFIKFFIIFSLCQGLLFMIGVNNLVYKISMTFLSLILFILLLNKRSLVTNYRFNAFFILYIISILISALFNKSDVVSTFSYILYILPGFVVYLYILRMNFNQNLIIKINNFIFVFFGFQILFSIYKLLFLGTSEAIAGTFHYSGGSYNTIIPLIAISMLISFYSFYKRNYKYLLFIIGFLFMSWVGEKRGIYFYFIILLLIHFISTIKFKIFNINSFFRFLLIIPFVLIIIFYGVKYSPTLNPENIMGGSFNLDHIYNYAFNYSYQLDASGFAGGRMSGMSSIFTTVISGDFLSLYFGSGPDMILGIGDDSINILNKYRLSQDIGINGWSTALISLGLFGAIITICLYFYILRFSYINSNEEKDMYWKSLNYGLYLIMIVFFLDFFTYTRAFYHHIGLNVIIFYLFAINSLRYLSLKNNN